MELDARLLITLGGMLLSVASSFIVTRQKCLQLEEDSKQANKFFQSREKYKPNKKARRDLKALKEKLNFLSDN